MNRRIDILRLIRLQLRSGYLKSEPLLYDAMKTTPSLKYKQSEEFVTTRIPYAGLLEKAYEKNPALKDETVFPAYGNLEPRALILAKKQYFYMQQGMTEEVAYEKALEFVEELEAQAYDDMNEVLNELKTMGGQAPIYSVPHISEQLALWQEILRTRSYDKLTLAEQGELDMFVQTHILQWTEVERERRMKDIAFHKSYEKLIKALFPSGEELSEAQRREFQTNFSRNFLKLHGYALEDLKTERPFIVEEYFQIFEAARLSENWKDDDYEMFQNWVEQTLQFKTAIKAEKSSYFDDVLDQFFPILALPSRIKHLKLPSIEEVRSLLYRNKIGYKSVDDQLFVKRFYMLPRLLFPIDSFCASVARSEVLFFKVINNRDILLEEMKKEGLSESDFEQVNSILQENRNHILAKHRSVRTTKILEDEEDKLNRSSVLGDLDDDDEEDDDEDIDSADAGLSPEELALMEKVLADPELAELVANADLSEEELFDLLKSLNLIDSSLAEKLSAKATPHESAEEEGEEEDDSYVVDRYGPGLTKASAEWPTVFDKYIKKPKSALAKERENFYLAQDLPGEGLENLESERDLKQYIESRSELEILVRARLAVLYEKKEAARREQDESLRNLMKESDFPVFEAPIVNPLSK